jgi:hypothetical protein
VDTIEARYDELLVKAMLIPVTTPADFETAARAAMRAVLEDVRDVAVEFTSEAHCQDAPGCDFCVNVALITARIDSLGNEEG